jgi:type II secretory pathway pseudopilin PulG
MKKYQILNQIGRSMIEMLGVLMIIGLLSVLGIYGYLKAMDKVSLTKQTQQISDFSIGLLDFIGKTRETAFTTEQVAVNFVQLGYLPDSMLQLNANKFSDSFGNAVTFGEVEDNFIIVRWNFTSTDQFVNLVQSLVRFSDKLYVIWINSRNTWQGDRICSSDCISSLTLSDIYEKGNQYSPSGYILFAFYRK